MAKQPEKIDKYSEASLIARGGMGAVYKAMHPTLNRPVILKKLTLRGKSSFAERFKREARILMDFRHDDIVTVFDHFKQGSSYYIVMEYVEGTSLEGLIREHRYLDSVISAYILLHSAKALGYAHRRGVVHRDIKPANILLSRDGAIKLADFGIAASAEDTDSGLTSEGMTLGTPSYMAPEQFENSKNVDSKADIYSLGVMAYEMSTGKRPFSGGFTPELLNAKQKGKYPNPKRFVPGIAGPLLKIIHGTMRTSRKRRYHSVDPVIKKSRKVLRGYNQAEIREYLGALVRGEKEPALPRRKRRTGRRLLQTAAGVAAVTLFAWGLFTSTLLQPLFLGSTHGRLRITIDVPDVPGQYARTPVEALLFVDDADTIPQVADPLLIPLPSGEADSAGRFSSLPLFLPARNYRLKILWAGNVYWRSFVLVSYANMRDGTFFPETVQKITLTQPEHQPVRVERHVRDALNNKDLGDLAVILLETPGGEIPLAQTPAVTSGGVRRFRVTAPGYIEQEFSLYIHAGETHVSLDAELLPEPAVLRLDGLPEGLKLTINGSDWINAYYPLENNAGRSYTLAPFRIRDAGTDPLRIPPGNYRVEAHIKGASGILDLNAAAGENVGLSFIQEGESLEIHESRIGGGNR